MVNHPPLVWRNHGQSEAKICTHQLAYRAIEPGFFGLFLAAWALCGGLALIQRRGTAPVGPEAVGEIVSPIRERHPRGYSRLAQLPAVSALDSRAREKSLKNFGSACRFSHSSLVVPASR